MALTQADLTTVLADGIDPQYPGPYQQLLDDLQGNILKGHGRDRSVHLFLQFNAKNAQQQQQLRQRIKDFTNQYVTSAQKQADDAQRYRETNVSGGLFASLSLSMQGYLQLGLKYHETPSDTHFRAGMKDLQVWAALGDDPPRNAILPLIRSWDKGFADRIDALILLADDDDERLKREVDQLKKTLSPVAKILRQEEGFVLRNQNGQVIEHFGFVDGISQPLFLKRDIDRAKQRNDSFDQWDPRAPLNLVLAKDPNGKTPDSYGSYLVYRKLEQNVKGFRQQIQELAEALGISVELAEAYAVGRFRDGTPVTLSDTPDPDKNTNNFSYAADMQGARCPFHAHIRKTNPRGDTTRITPPGVPLEEERMHRIARRGISYGEIDPQAEPETGSGLLFLCFQADIQSQFFFMQGLWSNSLNFVNPKVGRDPVIGQGAIFPDDTNQHFWPKQWDQSDFAEFNFALWVKMKGGESFFSPSISFLKSLA